MALFIELFAIYLIVNQRRWPNFKYVLAILIFIPVFSFIGQNRDYFKSVFSDEVYENRFVNEDVEGFFEKQDTLDFANYEYLVYIYSVVPDMSQTYSYGTQYLQLFTEPVPRVLWPGKPVGPPIKMVNLMDFGNFTGLTRSSIGDAWINFGYLGVILNMILIGGVLSWMYNRVLLGNPKITAIFYVVMLPYLIQLFRDGGVVSIVKFLVFAFLPLIVVWLIYTRLERK